MFLETSVGVSEVFLRYFLENVRHINYGVAFALTMSF